MSKQAVKNKPSNGAAAGRPLPIEKAQIYPAPEVQPHKHSEYEHSHEHSHELVSHEHSAVPQHGHDPHDHTVPKHEHSDLRAELRGAVRALLRVIKVGSVNAEQRKAIHAVRVIIGDAHGNVCAHENVAYEEGDVLICQDCRARMA